MLSLKYNVYIFAEDDLLSFGDTVSVKFLM